MDSREFFTQARDAALSIDRRVSAIERLKGDIGLKAQTYGPKGRSGGIADPSRGYDRRIDAIDRLDREIEAARAIVADAETVCLGIEAANPHNKGWSDAIYLYYLQGMLWKQAARYMGYSTKHTVRLANAGLDWVDGVGIARARGYGEGAV